MNKYVLGFAFLNDEINGHSTAVILKKRPDWQAGKYNGIGGHLKLGEPGHEAMTREFLEETGVEVATAAWQYRGVMGRRRLKAPSQNWECAVYKLDFDPLAATGAKIKTMTDESVAWVPTHRLLKAGVAFASDDYYGRRVIPNLNWLIPLCLYPTEILFNIEYPE